MVVDCQFLHLNVACNVNVFRFDESFFSFQMNLNKGTKHRKLTQCQEDFLKWFFLFLGLLKSSYFGKGTVLVDSVNRNHSVCLTYIM